MSESSCCSEKTKTLIATFVGTIGAFLVIGGLAWLVVRQPVADVESVAAANRKAVRLKIEQEGVSELSKYAIDPAKENLARLSVDRAMEVLVTEWSGGSTEGRAKLLERLEASKKTQSFE